MPFRKVGPDKYKSPSGRTFNTSQVRLYYSRGGRFPGQKSDNPGNPGGPGMKDMSQKQIMGGRRYIDDPNPKSSLPTRRGGQHFGPR
jgi:hypothetical protein